MGELRERKLRPGPLTPRREVARSQRERLFGAMVVSVAEKGYEATTVADLLDLSGVSRSTFYEHFCDKEQCFLSTFEAIVAKAMELISQELQADIEPDAGARQALRRVFQMVADQPAAARLCFNDAYSAGKPGHMAVTETMTGFALLTNEAIGRVDQDRNLPPELVYGLLGGAQSVVQFHLRREETAALPDAASDLWDWALSYEAPPEPLRRVRRQRASSSERRPSSLAAYSQDERILRALAAAATQLSYPAVTIAEITKRASVSQATFYSHFADKDTALLAALDFAATQTLAAMLPAGRRAVDWPHGVRAAIGALCAYGATEPDLVCLAAIEAYTAGRLTMDQRDRMIDGIRSTLTPGFDLAPETKPIVADAVVGAVWTLLHRQILDGGPESLPEAAPLASYMVLAPFVGAERACEVANGDGRSARKAASA